MKAIYNLIKKELKELIKIDENLWYKVDTILIDAEYEVSQEFGDCWMDSDNEESWNVFFSLVTDKKIKCVVYNGKTHFKADNSYNDAKSWIEERKRSTLK